MFKEFPGGGVTSAWLRRSSTVITGIAIFAGAQASPAISSMQVSGLKSEHLTEPLGIESAHPRLRWLLESSERGQLQRAYQVLVASSLEKLAAGEVDRWNSGRVYADNSTEVFYAGRALASGERAYWKVRVWDRNGYPSAYSTPSFFEMGLLEPRDWQGVWIAAPQAVSAPLLRRPFSLEAPVHRARVYVSGLGYHELYLNGRKVDERVLDPASTTYRVDGGLTLKSRVLYSVYDVTRELQSGENVIGVMLGHGWYSSEPLVTDIEAFNRRKPYGDRPCLKLQLNIELANGRTVSIVSDTTWKSSGGPITYNDLENGEQYDARLEQPGWNRAGFNDARWVAVTSVAPPSTTLNAQLMPPERVVQTLPVVKTLTPRSPGFFDGVKVYDFGQNFSGWARIAVSGPRGAKLVLRYAARVYPEDDTLDARSNTVEVREARQRDVYTLKGEGREVWEPRFTLHGFRYLEIRSPSGTVSIQRVEGRFVRTAVEETGSFASSNELLSRIHQNIRWTLLSSFQGIPQDAAERKERVAFIGDVGFTVEDYLSNFDMAAFWEKWLDDIEDNQMTDGNIPVVVPPHSGVADEYVLWPSFTSAYPRMVWGLYEYYGDKGVLERHYASLRQLTDFLMARARDDLIADELLGDHEEPQENGSSSMFALHTPRSLTANAYYFYTVRTLGRIAEALGRRGEAREYQKRAARIQEAFNRRFFDAATSRYGSGSQTSNALPLYLGMVPAQKTSVVMKNLVDDIVSQHDIHVSTGIIGTDALVQALPQYGAADLLYRLANQTTYPSLGHQVMRGETTVCEVYECGPYMSPNMKMFCSWDKFFYRDLAGVRPLSPGYRRVLIRPRPVGDLRHVTATQRTVRGEIAVEWNRGIDTFDLRASIPAGMEADIAVPRVGLNDAQISEGTMPAWRSGTYVPGVPGLSGARAQAEAIVFQVGSGIYHFTVKGKTNQR